MWRFASVFACSCKCHTNLANILSIRKIIQFFTAEMHQRWGVYCRVVDIIPIGIMGINNTFTGKKGENKYKQSLKASPVYLPHVSQLFIWNPSWEADCFCWPDCTALTANIAGKPKPGGWFFPRAIRLHRMDVCVCVCVWRGERALWVLADVPCLGSITESH